MKELIDAVEKYGFECEAGPLNLCNDWLKLKEHLKSTELLSKQVANKERSDLARDFFSLALAEQKAYTLKHAVVSQFEACIGAFKMADTFIRAREAYEKQKEGK
jgi:hypothetical protein